jgi:L-lysine 4-chlorinase
MVNGETFDGVRETLGAAKLRDWSQRFRRFGIITVTEMIPDQIRERARPEAEALLESYAERRDLTLATTDHSPRMMSVVPSEAIAAHGKLIAEVYRDKKLIELLEAIAGERLVPCPRQDEEFLISRHERQGDTHGWHWGDYSFALIWVLLAPPRDVGGLLQCVPHTNWDKSSPEIHRYLCENPINTYYFGSGDVYFLRTDTTLHRTIPLRVDATRIMLNMTWASEKDLARTIGEEDRWWEDSSVQAAVPIRE